MRPRWWSQPFPPDGGVASEGIRRQLGTPTLDPLTVLVRETAQNSWDARVGESEVRVTYELVTLDAGRRRTLEELLLPGPDPELESALASGTALLTVSDRGTTGLGGELRSDRTGPDAPDFVNFVRNVGETRPGDHDGGTYGFGKAILFNLSHANTVIVSTRCVYRGRPQHRLIGATVGASFERGGRRYTGRHWWGIVAEDGIVDPLLDATAAEYACRLGLPAFDGDDTGTDLLVVAPALGVADAEAEEETGPRTIRQAAELIAGSALWHLWPNLVGTQDGAAPLRVIVRADGEEIPVGDPAAVPVLRPFVKAYRGLESDRARTLKRSRAPRVVGHVASEPALEPVPPGSEPAGAAAPFSGLPRHCARMRSVGLVVDYLEGPPSDDPRCGYAAVFRSTPQADPHFAAAEPPTHDSWQTAHLTGTDVGVVRSVVRSANRFIREVLISCAGRDRSAPQAGAVPLGALSARLARLLPNTVAEGATGTGGGDGGEGRAGRTRFTWVRQPHLEVNGDRLHVVGTVRVADVPDTVELCAEAGVGLDGGGTESDPPIGAAVPAVLGWRADGEERLRRGATIRITADDPRTWTVVVRPVPDTTTSVRVRDLGSGRA